MKLACLCVLGALLAAIGPATGGDARASSPHITAAPNQAHPGGEVFVSGSGFLPRTRLSADVRCPGASLRLAGPLTGARGQFLAFGMTVPHLRLTRTGKCEASLHAGTSSARASFAIVPASRPLTHCAATMCLRITALLVRLRNYAQGNIAVAGWPGAASQVTVLQPGGHNIVRSLRLDWRGAGAIRVHVAPGLRKAVQARVMVRARLGSISGSGIVPFSVVPGGR